MFSLLTTVVIHIRDHEKLGFWPKISPIQYCSSATSHSLMGVDMLAIG